MTHFDPESIDLAELAKRLRASCGPTVAGAIMGRTRLRDEVIAKIKCSLLEAEQLIDTMISRGFLVKQKPEEGPECWEIKEP